MAIAAGILLSRLVGVLRQRAFAEYFGTSIYADVFTASFRLPNLLQNLLGEGTLSASFIPVYARLVGQGRREDSGRLAGALFALLLAVAGAMAIAGIVFTRQLVWFLLPGFTGERYELTVYVARILFPMTGLLVLSAWALGILNSHRRFLVAYSAPVVWNLTIIGAFVIWGGWLGSTEQRLLVAVAVAALIGGALQFLVQMPWVLAVEPKLKVRWDTSDPGLRETVRNAGPAVLGRGVVQLSGFFDGMLASLLAVGAVSTIQYAQTLYMLPISLFGMSIAAAELPEMALAGAEVHEALKARMRAAIDRVAFYVLPSAVGFVVLGNVAVAAVFRKGAFGLDEVRVVHATLAAYSLGLMASSSTRVLSSAFYAMSDTRTPARISTIRVLVSAAASFALMTQLEPIPFLGLPAGSLAHLRIGDQPLGAVGLGLGTAAAAWIEWVLLRRALAARIGPLPGALGYLARLLGAAGIGAVLGVALDLELGALPPIPLAVVVFGVFGVVYVGLCAALGVPEAARFVGRIGARFRR